MQHTHLSQYMFDLLQTKQTHHTDTLDSAQLTEVNDISLQYFL